MKLIKQSYEIWDGGESIDDIYSHITKCGYICYKTDREITSQSAKAFIDRLIKSGHTSVLEHGTIYLTLVFDSNNYEIVDAIRWKYLNNAYSSVRMDEDVWTNNVEVCCITTNLRVLVENNWLDDLKYLTKPSKYHERRITVKLITSIGIGRELTRHRTFSFSQESTRYCNYSNESKFGDGILFIDPTWLEDASELQQTYFMQNCEQTEQYYEGLIKEGCQPQQAREVLPLATKSELVMTGFASDWKHVFDLRVDNKTGKAHPDVVALLTPVKEEFIKRDLIND